MWIRNVGFGLIGAVAAVLGAGCNKSAPSEGTGGANRPLETIACIHWLGKDRVGADPQAATLMGIWKMPESARLEAQTLDKLSTAPWRLLHLPDRPSTLNAPRSTLLRPLLDDLLLQEWYLEIRQAGTNQPGELALAIRLKPQRAALWQTNLAAVVESLTEVRPAPATGAETAHATKAENATKAETAYTTPSPGWHSEFTIDDLRFTSPKGKVAAQAELRRVGDWTLVGLALEQKGLLADMAGRIQRDHAPFARPKTNFWLEADLDARRVGEALGLDWDLPSNTTRISANWLGDGKDVHTHAELGFPRALGLQLDTWNVPTNLIHDPLIGFMAVRGIRPWLEGFKPWNDWDLGRPPNQAYFWAQRGPPGFHFMSLPSPQARDQVVKLSNLIVDKLNPILATNDMHFGRLLRRTNSLGMVWRGYPLMAPDLRYTNFDGNAFIVAGFSPTMLSDEPPRRAIFQQLDAGTNLVWYDWELTGRCSEGLGQLAQLARYYLNRPRLSQSAGLTWLIAAIPKLGNSVTAIRLTGPSHLSFTRASTIGLTAMEIQVFIDWLESPEFPVGLHTFLAKPEPTMHGKPVAAETPQPNGAPRRAKR